MQTFPTFYPQGFFFKVDGTENSSECNPGAMDVEAKFVLPKILVQKF